MQVLQRCNLHSAAGDGSIAGMTDDLPAFLARVRPPSTPALVVRRAALMANLRAMQAACDAAGVRLRAHGKMHKCSTLGRLQVELGAVGLCCQTVGEAEAFARAGIADLLVTAPVPPWGAPRLAAVAAAGTRVAAVADSPAQVERLGAAAVAAGTTLGVLVDVNIGMHRAGASPDDAPTLINAMSAAPGLRWEGVQCYLGHLQHQKQDRAAAHAAAQARLKALVDDLRAAGLPPALVTGGGTGTYALDLAGGVFNEVQCGSYAVMDRDYHDCGGPEGRWPFAPALLLAATVVSARHKSHVTVDAGLKALAFDSGPPRIVTGAPAGSQFRPAGDEHGTVLHPSALPRLGGGESVDALDADAMLPWPTDAPREADIVWLQPGHCDPTIALYDRFWVADEDGRLEAWPVDARRAG